jgi:predicted nucleic acid-binding Zn ribbon protein
MSELIEPFGFCRVCGEPIKLGKQYCKRCKKAKKIQKLGRVSK